MSITKRLLFVALLLVPTFAVAEKTEKVSVGVTERKREQPKKQAPASTRITRSQAFIIATETRLREVIRDAIKVLERNVERTPKKSSSRLKYREKLIDLRLELAVFEASAELREYDEKWEKWDAGGRKTKEPKLDSSRSQKQWNVLAQDAAQLLKEFPRSKNADTVMFNMGLAYIFLNREKDGARTFSELISKYPASQKAGDAYFSLGDFYFDRNDFRNASNNYTNALRYKNSKTYAWALFKLGWCSYNLGKYDTALDYWKKTVASSRRNQKSGAQLREEALRDMVYAFAELQQIEPAIAYYRANGGTEYIDRFLQLLSETFSYQGKYKEAIQVLKRYQQVAPYAEGTPNSQKEIVALHYELGNMRAVWAELARFPQLYGPKSAWSSRNEENKKAVLETQAMIRDQILYYAKITHKNAQKSENAGQYAEATKGYQLFLQTYPDAIEKAEVLYNMADIDYFSKRYAEAGRRYQMIAMMPRDKAVIVDPVSKKSRDIYKESSEFMLESYSKDFLPEYERLLKLTPDFDKPQALSTRAQNFVRGCAFYVKRFPGDKKNVKVCDIYVTAIYYRTGNKKNATTFLWNLAKKYPGEKEGTGAVRDLLGMYKDNDKAKVSVADQALAIKNLDPKLRKDIEELKFGIESKACGNAQLAPLKKATTCLDLYKKRPSHPEAPVFLYNAGLNFIKSNKLQDGLSAYGTLVEKFPTFEKSAEVTLEIAQIHEAKLEYAQAIKFYSTYFAKFPKAPKRDGALAKTCELSVAIEASNALGVCRTFAGVDPGTAKVFVERLMRAAYSSRSGDVVQYVNYYLTLPTSPAEKIVALNMISRLGGAAAGSANAKIMEIFRGARGNVEGEALRAVGGLVFRQVNGEMERFQKLKLVGGTVDAMLGSINQKAQGMQRLSQAYDQVLQTKDAYWGVAALYQLGYSRELIARELENPPAINGASIENVKKQLAGDAAGARKEAETFYRQAIQAVAKFQVYNEWAALAVSGLARNGGKDVSFDDIVVKPDFIGAAVPADIADAVR